MGILQQLTLTTILISLQVLESQCLLSEELGPSRIMMLPMPGENHTQESSFSHLADELIGLGHDVFLLIPQDYTEVDQLKKQGIKPLMYGSGNSRSYRDLGRDYQGGNQRSGMSYDEFVRRQVPFHKTHCSSSLGDPDLLQRLRRMNFDLAIVDAHPLSRCLYAIPYRLGVPFVSVAKHDEPRLQAVPMMPSIQPFVFGTDFTEQMSFWQRFNNLWSFISWNADPKIEMLQADYLSRFIPEKSAMHADDLARDSMLWLMETDPVLDYPSPRMPNMINVGGLTTRRAKQIPNDLGRFMDEAKDGVIVVDLGLQSDSMPYDVTDKLTSAFKQTRYTVVWHQSGERPNRHSVRIRAMDDLPRNDLLGHINTRLYISDGDHNGQYEALFHGIPSIIFPDHGAHSYAANRAVYRGYGLRMNLDNFTPNQLIEAIEEITRNQSFTENIQKASRIFRSRLQNPRERAAEGIEHVLQYGGDYRKTYGMIMNWWSYYLLDLVAFWFSLVFFIYFVTYRLLKCVVVRLVYGRPRHHSYEDEDEYMYEGEGKSYTSQEGPKMRGGYRGAYKAKRY